MATRQQRAIFPRDKGLQSRMLLTLFLLGLLYVVLIGALVAAGTGLIGLVPVSYTHLTLPTIYSV